MGAARLVLDRMRFDAEYVHGGIGWEFWCREGDAFPARTVEMLGQVDAALFGAITSKPVRAAEAFEFAKQHGRRKVTIIHKANVVRATDGMFLEIGKAVAKEFPDLRGDDANIGEKVAVFEPTHGSAPMYGRPVPRQPAGHDPVCQDDVRLPRREGDGRTPRGRRRRRYQFRGDERLPSVRRLSPQRPPRAGGRPAP
jgi:isocitrate/isopropylmalate dehydrogenase